MNEKTLERKLQEKIKQLGGIALKFASATFTGMPDRLVLVPGGVVYFVELKSKGKKPTARQKLVHERLIQLGFKVWVIDSDTGLYDFLKCTEGCSDGL